MFGDLKQESPWESYKLSELFDLTMGKTPSRDTPKYWSNGIYPWVSISDITSSNGVINDTKEKISEDAVAESGIKQIDAGTVLMSFKLSIGKTALTKFPLYTNEAIVAFVPKKSEVINNSFLQEWIKEKNWNEGSNKAVKGATLNKATLKEMRIHIPPIRLQNQFADFVGQVNKSKRTYKRIFESFDNLVKSRFIEMFGTIDNSHFKYTALEQLCYILDSQRIPITAKDRLPGPYPYYGANGVQHYVADCIFDDELILLAEDGGHFDEIGRIAYMISGKCWVNNHAHILKPKSGLNIYYLLHSLNMIDLSMEVNGTTRQKLTQAAMRRIKLPLPPVELQNQFADFVQQVDKSKFVETVKPDHPAVFQNVHGFPSFGLIST